MYVISITWGEIRYKLIQLPWYKIYKGKAKTVLILVLPISIFRRTLSVQIYMKYAKYFFKKLPINGLHSKLLVSKCTPFSFIAFTACSIITAFFFTFVFKKNNTGTGILPQEARLFIILLIWYSLLLYKNT